MSGILQCSAALKPSLSALLATLTYTILWPLIVVRIALAIGLMRIASSLPIIKDEIKRYNEKFLLVPYENFWQSWCSLKMLREVVRINLADLHRKARLGSSAPNCKLVSTDGREYKLLDLPKGNRPLVLNFGSCSWPPFFIRLQNDFSKVVREFADVADFLVVYISEAHPTDGWRWNVSIVISYCKQSVTCDTMLMVFLLAKNEILVILCTRTKRIILSF